MKKPKTIFSVLLLLTLSASFAQMKEIKVGHSFTISIPDYLTRSVGLNDVASVQFQSSVKEVYGIVIEDNKEELTIAEMNYSSLEEFAEDFKKDFLNDEPTKKLTDTKIQKKGGNSVAEFEATYMDKESNIEIYYYVGIVETGLAYYKVLCWCENAEKAKYRDDFKKIAYSLKD